MSKKLNDRQEVFCREYIKDLNATRAAIRAGYSDKTAQPTSARLLSNAMVQARIATLVEIRVEAVQYDAEKLLSDLLEVLEVAKDRALEGNPRDIAAFKGLADTVGKHVDIQAYSERHTHDHNHSGPTVDTNRFSEEVMREMMQRARDKRPARSVH